MERIGARVAVREGQARLRGRSELSSPSARAMRQHVSRRFAALRDGRRAGVPEVKGHPFLVFEVVAKHAGGDHHQSLPLLADVHVREAGFRVEVDRGVPWIRRPDEEQFFSFLRLTPA